MTGVQTCALPIWHRDLTVVTGPRASWTGQELGRAAAERAAELGLGLHLIGPNPPTEDGGATAAEEVVELGGTAVLTHNDLMAIGLIRGLRHLGRQVPRDMSVIGVDNTDAGRHSDPSLTTVDMPTSAAGRTAIDLLLQSVTLGGTLGTVSLDTGLVARESTGPPPPSDIHR